jgi:hypothetical protein
MRKELEKIDQKSSHSGQKASLENLLTSSGRKLQTGKRLRSSSRILKRLKSAGWN